MQVAAWKGAWWRHTIRGSHHTGTDPGRRRLSSRHRTLGKRRWHEAIQQQVMTETRDEVPRQIATEDRIRWTSTEFMCFDRLATAQGGGSRASVGRTLDGTRNK